MVGLGDLADARLDTLGGGGIPELFGIALKKVVANMLDENTLAERKRSITIDITIAPAETRDFAALHIEVSTKLAGIQPILGVLHFGQEDGKLVAKTKPPAQINMFAEHARSQVGTFKGE